MTLVNCRRCGRLVAKEPEMMLLTSHWHCDYCRFITIGRPAQS